MIDFRKIVNSTDFLKQLRERVPDQFKEQWDEYIEAQIQAHEKVVHETADEIVKETGEKDVPESKRE